MSHQVILTELGDGSRRQQLATSRRRLSFHESLEGEKGMGSLWRS